MLSNIYFITRDHPEISHLDQIHEACRAGIKAVQLRLKDVDFTEWLHIAQCAREICEAYGCTFIVNDNVLIAKHSAASGVHLGKKDLDPAIARALLGEDVIIGATANSTEDILRLATFNIDYIGLGPFRLTETKKRLDPVLGNQGILSALTALRETGKEIPVFGVGGILLEEASDLLSLGLHGVAISSDLVNRFLQPDISRVSYGIKN